MSDEKQTATQLLEQAVNALREVMVELAGRLQPFPPFMGMTSLQAIELEPPPQSGREWGCVVVLPDGEICELELEVIPGPVGPTDVDQVDRYRAIDLSTVDYLHFAASAIRLMALETFQARGQLGRPAAGVPSLTRQQATNRPGTGVPAPGTIRVLLGFPAGRGHQPLLHGVDGQERGLQGHQTEQIGLTLAAEGYRGKEGLTSQAN